MSLFFSTYVAKGNLTCQSNFHWCTVPHFDLISGANLIQFCFFFQLPQPHVKGFTFSSERIPTICQIMINLHSAKAGASTEHERAVAETHPGLRRPWPRCPFQTTSERKSSKPRHEETKAGSLKSSLNCRWVQYKSDQTAAIPLINISLQRVNTTKPYRRQHIF